MYQAFHCEGAKRTTKIFSPCEQHLSIGQQRGARVLCINLTSTRKASSKRLAFLRSAAIDLPAIASYHSLTDGHAVTTRRPEQLGHIQISPFNDIHAHKRPKHACLTHTRRLLSD